MATFTLSIGFAFPIGIDPEAIAEMASRAVKSRAARRLQESLRGRQLIIGVDRLDYSKGLEHRFKAFAGFLDRYPAYRNHVRFLQIATATRSDVPDNARSLASFGSAASLLSLHCATE